LAALDRFFISTNLPGEHSK
jgi:hypothetical protein